MLNMCHKKISFYHTKIAAADDSLAMTFPWAVIANLRSGVNCNPIPRALSLRGLILQAEAICICALVNLNNKTK